jgi:carbon-monoxide dehydrogenase medium subunit
LQLEVVVQDFEFERPGSVSAAVEALRRAPEGKYLAGGQSLIPVMKLGLAAPSTVVSLTGIADLAGIRVDGRELVVGAGTVHADVASSPEVARVIPALADLAAHIGDPQVRNRGTLGGSLAHDDPAADYPAAVLGLAAIVQTDRRRIAADDFFKGLYQTALEPDELITAVRFPIPEKAGYVKFPHPSSRFAVVGVFVARTGGGVRVAVTGAGPTVFRIPEMEKALSARFAPDAIAGVTVPSDGLQSDIAASAEYRAHLVGVMARRAVAACG